MVETAGQGFALWSAVLMLGLPVAAILSGDHRALFYVHVGLAAFWFGLDLFFKLLVEPSLRAASSEAAGDVSSHLVPKMSVAYKPLNVGTIGSGIALAYVLGYFWTPTVWLWGALVVAAGLVVVGMGPLHVLTTKISVELNAAEPDGERLEALFGRAKWWGWLQTALMLAAVGMMTGIRWGI